MPRTKLAKKSAPAWGLLTLGLICSVIASWQIKENIDRDHQQQLKFNADQITLKIEDRLASYELALRGGAALFSRYMSVTREDWRHQIESLNAARTLPGVQGFGFAQALRPHQIAPHIKAIRSDGFSEYSVHPAGTRDFYTSIVYLEPFDDRNQRAFGFDMYSEPVRRAAMQKARDTGQATISGKVTLLQEDGNDVQAGALMYLPVYRHRMPTATVKQRQSAILGWVYSPFRMKDLVEGMLGVRADAKSIGLILHIYDGQSASDPGLLFDSKIDAKDTSPSQPPFSMTRTILFNDRPWLLTFNPLPDAMNASHYASAWAVLVAGVLLSGFLFGFVQAVSNTRFNALALAQRLTSKIREREAALKDSEYRWKFAVEGSGDGLWDWRRGDDTLYLSPRWKEMLGYHDDEIGNDRDSWQKLIHPDDFLDAVTAGRAYLDGRSESYRHEHRLRCKDGSWKWVLSRGTVVSRSADGRAQRVIGTHSDISARKANEVLIKTSQERFQDLVNTTDGIVWEADVATYAFTFVSQKAERLFGYPIDEWLVPGFWTAHLHPDDRVWATEFCDTHTKNKAPYDFEYRFMAQDGQIIWLRDIGSVVTENGQAIVLRGLMIDITHQKLIEKRLKVSEETYRMLAENSSDWIWAMNVHGTHTYCNDHGLKILGLSNEEFSTVDFFSLLHPDDLPIIHATFQQAVRLAQGWRGVSLRTRNKAGNYRWLESNATPTFDENGALTGFHGVDRDVTEHRLAEFALRESEFRWRFAIDAIGDGLWDLSVPENTLYLSPHWKLMLGYADDEVGNTFEAWATRIHPDDADKTLTSAQCFLDGDTDVYLSEHRLRCKDGNWKWILSRGAAVWRDEDGRPTRVIGTHFDLSERKNAELALRAADQRFLDIVNTTDGIVWEVDVNTQCFTFVSQPAVRLLGFPTSDWYQPDFWITNMHPLDRTWAPEFCAAASQRLETHDFEYRMIAKGGTTVWLRDMVTVVAEDGQPRWLRGIMVDISKHKALEAALRESEYRWKFAIEGAGDGLWDWNLSDETVYYSPRWKEMLGYSQAEISDRLEEWKDRLHPDDREDTYLRLQEHFEGLLPIFQQELRMRCKDGSWKWIFCRGMVVSRSADDEPVRMIGTHTDVTDRKAAEDKIAVAMNQAKAATKAKSEFLAHMSHEIRTPMNAIVGAARLLADEDLTQRQLAYTRIMRHSSHLLMSLIDDILDFSKIEAGRIELRKDTFSLDSLFEGLAGLAAVSAEGKDIKIIFDLAPDLPSRLIGDAMRFEQVLNNLMSNAIKFTPQGKICLRAERLPEVSGAIPLRIIVSDTGIGIPAERLAAIFDPFVQAENTITRAHDGTGLGLSICRSLVEMMEGTIEAISEIGKGSEFTVTALFRIPENSAPPEIPLWLAGRRIGLIEPDADTRQATARLLKSLGADVISSAGCGTHCLCNASPSVDVLMIDSEVAKRSIGFGALEPRPPVIVTGRSNADKGHWREGEDETSQQLALVKPLTRQMLVKVLATAFGIKKSVVESVPAKTLAFPLAGRRILMVEDNQFNRVVLDGMLQRLELDVDVAIDGNDAIECFKAGGPYDAILMDIHMPGLNGFDCARAIRCLPEGTQVPIIAVTADILPETIDSARDAGMNDHLSKPVEPETLSKTLCYWILGENETSHHEVSSEAPATDDLPATLPGIDIAKARKWSNSSARALLHLLDRLFLHCGDNPKKLEQYIGEGKTEPAAQITHDLIGVASTVGASVLATAASGLNKEIRGGRPDNRPALAALRQIENEFIQLDLARKALRQQVD